MRPIVIFLALAGIGVITWLVVARPGIEAKEPKQQAIVVSKHSDAFNSQVNALLNDYYKISEQFVNWDSTGAKHTASNFLSGLNTINLDELKKDTMIYLTAQTFIDNIKANAETMAAENRIRPQREVFHNLTDNLYQLMNTIKYDRQKLYLQECPMAFDDTKEGLWISKIDSIRNPYLGLYDPYYKSGMLKCGETKTVINHTGSE